MTATQRMVACGSASAFNNLERPTDLPPDRQRGRSRGSAGGKAPQRNPPTGPVVLRGTARGLERGASAASSGGVSSAPSDDAPSRERSRGDGAGRSERRVCGCCGRPGDVMSEGRSHVAPLKECLDCDAGVTARWFCVKLTDPNSCYIAHRRQAHAGTPSQQVRTVRQREPIGPVVPQRPLAPPPLPPPTTQATSELGRQSRDATPSTSRGGWEQPSTSHSPWSPGEADRWHGRGNDAESDRRARSSSAQHRAAPYHDPRARDSQSRGRDELPWRHEDWSARVWPAAASARLDTRDRSSDASSGEVSWAWGTGYDRGRSRQSSQSAERGWSSWWER